MRYANVILRIWRRHPILVPPVQELSPVRVGGAQMSENLPAYLAGDNSLPEVIQLHQRASITPQELAALRRELEAVKRENEGLRKGMPVVWNITDPVPDLIKNYYSYRYNGEMPDELDALLFAVAEAGELADAFVSEKPGWIRNNPDKVRSVPFEVGDLLQMLYVFCIRRGIDPVACMLSKWRSKGWRPQE